MRAGIKWRLQTAWRVLCLQYSVREAYNAGKKIKGRKRYIVTDITGNMLEGTVHGADVHDRDSAPDQAKGVAVLPKTVGRRADLCLASRCCRLAEDWDAAS